EVIFQLGHLSSATDVAMRVSFVAARPGPLNFCSTVSGNNDRAAEANTGCVNNMVEGVVAPMMSIRRVSSANVEVGLTGEAQRTYTIESSTDLRNWTKWKTDAAGPTWSEILQIDGV